MCRSSTGSNVPVGDIPGECARGDLPAAGAVGVAGGGRGGEIGRTKVDAIVMRTSLGASHKHRGASPD